MIEFNLSSAKQSFDTQFGVSQWTIQSVLLQLTATANNNAIFNTTAAGQFDVSLMQNNSWAEGTGTPASPTTDGITFTTLQSTFINNAADQSLGSPFSFGGGSSGSNIFTLSLTSGLTSDLLAGTNASLRLSAADSQVSYLFNSRSGGSSTSHPELIINVIPEPGTAALGASALATVGLWRLATQRKRSRDLPA